MDKSLTRFVALLVAVACVFIIVLGIQSAASVINSILLAALITIAVMPIPQALIKRGWNASLTIIISLVVVVGVIALFVVVISVSVGNVADAFSTGTIEGVSAPQEDVNESDQTLIERLNNLSKDETTSQALAAAIEFMGAAIGQAFTVLMIMLFMLGAVVTTPIAERFEEISGQGADRFTDLTRDVQQYISMTTAVNLLNGFVNTIFLWIVGVDFAILWGILAWITGYIPIVGFWLGIIPPILLAWVQFGPGTALFVLIVLSILNGAAENLLKPRIMGEGLNLSPLMIFVSLIFWSWVLGGAGALLAVPLTLIVISVLRSFDATKWVARLASAPIENKEEQTVAFEHLRKLWNQSLFRQGDKEDDGGGNDDGERLETEPAN